jgi:hypothetical protein
MCGRFRLFRLNLPSAGISWSYIVLRFMLGQIWHGRSRPISINPINESTLCSEGTCERGLDSLIGEGGVN